MTYRWVLGELGRAGRVIKIDAVCVNAAMIEGSPARLSHAHVAVGASPVKEVVIWILLHSGIKLGSDEGIGRILRPAESITAAVRVVLVQKGATKSPSSEIDN